MKGSRAFVLVKAGILSCTEACTGALLKQLVDRCIADCFDGPFLFARKVVDIGVLVGAAIRQAIAKGLVAFYQKCKCIPSFCLRF